MSHLCGLRVQLGITQAELAKRLGKPQSFISKAERFERRIDPGEFRAIALALGVDPADEFKDVSDRLSQSHR